MGLFSKREKQRDEPTRQEAIAWAFDLREIRESRHKHYDTERQQWRAKRRVGPATDGQWVDEGPFDRDDYNQRFHEWVHDAPNNPMFEVELYAAASLRGAPLRQLAQHFDRIAQAEAVGQR